MVEKEHIIDVLEEAKHALKTSNSLKLQHLSNQTIHSASIHQDKDSITIAVIIYTLSKIILRKSNLQIKNWPTFIKRFNGQVDLAIDSMQKDRLDKFNYYLEKARASLSNLSINLKPYIQEVLRKASINKASKLYEHGISLSQTSKLLGITRWELAEYIGQKNLDERPYSKSINTKRRIQMAMDFFND